MCPCLFQGARRSQLPEGDLPKNLRIKMNKTSIIKALISEMSVIATWDEHRHFFLGTG